MQNLRTVIFPGVSLSSQKVSVRRKYEYSQEISTVPLIDGVLAHSKHTF